MSEAKKEEYYDPQGPDICAVCGGSLDDGSCERCPDCGRQVPKVKPK